MAMELIETIELTASASSIEFTSIPQDGVDLLLVVSARSDFATGVEANINGTGYLTSQSTRNLRGSGSSVQSNSSDILAGWANGSSTTANTFSNFQTYFSNYTSSSAKSWSVDSVTEDNATTAYQFIAANLWNNTAAITSIALRVASNFVAGSTASLYKIS